MGRMYNEEVIGEVGRASQENYIEGKKSLVLFHMYLCHIMEENYSGTYPMNASACTREEHLLS